MSDASQDGQAKNNDSQFDENPGNVHAGGSKQMRRQIAIHDAASHNFRRVIEIEP